MEEVFFEADFVPLRERLQPLVQIRNHLRLEAPSGLTKRAFAATEEVTHDLETFLDDYDARSNVTFSTVTEFIASARGFGGRGTRSAT